MILSPSFSSSPAASGAVTGGGVAGLGLVSGGTLAGLFWGVGGGVSSSCRKEEAKDWNLDKRWGREIMEECKNYRSRRRT